ncbi:MAG TPA: hypothetical protein VFH73_22920 [Polyangia bacterium]|jgi:hypothetical protein|nr:hypothetical protein [Polyangia bacterium]
MAFLDDVKEWTEFDVAALALGRALGVFATGTTLTDAKAVLWTNGAVGNTLYGMLERMAWLGHLECDEEQQRYRAAPQRLHPLGAPDDVPALETGPPERAHISMSLGSVNGFRLEADRAGFRFLARVFDEIANSGLESGWQFQRDGSFKVSPAEPEFAFKLVDPTRDDSADKG